MRKRIVSTPEFSLGWDEAEHFLLPLFSGVGLREGVRAEDRLMDSVNTVLPLG